MIGNASKYLGLEDEQKTPQAFFISKYLNILKFSAILEYNPSSTPLNETIKLQANIATPLGCKFFKVYQNLTTSPCFVFFTSSIFTM
jgi:hypothetical protein